MADRLRSTTACFWTYWLALSSSVWPPQPAPRPAPGPLTAARWGALLGSLLAALLSGCATPGITPSPPGADKPLVAQPAPQPLVVLHTNDNWGEVEPCG